MGDHSSAVALSNNTICAAYIDVGHRFSSNSLDLNVYNLFIEIDRIYGKYNDKIQKEVEKQVSFFKEELMERACHPSRYLQIIDYEDLEEFEALPLRVK